RLLDFGFVLLGGLFGGLLLLLLFVLLRLRVGLGLRLCDLRCPVGFLLAGLGDRLLLFRGQRTRGHRLGIRRCGGNGCGGRRRGGRRNGRRLRLVKFRRAGNRRRERGGGRVRHPLAHRRQRRHG